MYSEDLLEQIRNANPIYDVVAEYVTLKKSGRSFMGLCPFHNEKTPSFTVNPERQIFHCFGCGEGGNVIGFVMKREGMSSPEAVRHLAARRGISKGLELDPNYPWALRTMGWSLLWQGDKAGALPLMERAQSLDSDPFSIGSLGYALAVSGDRVKAGQILGDLENLAKHRYVTPSASMVVYIGLGEKQKALERLEKCYEDRDPQCWPLKVEPFYDSLRTEPRFQALLKKVGLDP